MSSSLVRLQAAVAGTSSFRCGGTIRLKTPLKLAIIREDAPPIAISLPAAKEEMTGLMAACKEATFGKGMEDVLDPNYRSALCLERDAFLSSFSLEEYGVLSTIKTLLMPESTASSVTAELYKLNVYRSGDFFRSHVDTPRSPTMFGSLVVCLPQPHTGGQLKVKAPASSNDPDNEAVAAVAGHTFDWGPLSGEEPLDVQWAAFYSDCFHEILPVTSGHRCALLYVHGLSGS